MRWFIVLFLTTTSGYANAHQFTPTYPKLTPSYVTGIYKTEMELLNIREDVQYYKLGVFDKNWQSVPFAVTGNNKVFNVNYLERKNIDIYIRASDKQRVEYICTKSKILKSVKDPAIITSKICSKIK